MSEILVVEYPKTGNNERRDLSDLIHNPNERGWPFGNGDPEYWKFKDRLVVKGGKVLDLGVAVGRSSFFFALHGMDVLGYDNSRKWVNPKLFPNLSNKILCMGKIGLIQKQGIR